MPLAMSYKKRNNFLSSFQKNNFQTTITIKADWAPESRANSFDVRRPGHSPPSLRIERKSVAHPSKLLEVAFNVVDGRRSRESAHEDLLGPGHHLPTSSE